MTINFPIDPELAGLLQTFDRPVPDTAKELIVHAPKLYAAVLKDARE